MQPPQIQSLGVILAAAVPSSVALLLLLTVLSVAIVLGCIKWRKKHRQIQDKEEYYTTVDYNPPPPTLPPRQSSNVAYHARSELYEVCLESNVAYQPGRASTADSQAENVAETSEDGYEN